MDERLIPINGLIALLRGGGGWPAPLGAAGFQRHQLEMPLLTPKGNIRADAVIYRLAPDLILLCECKSGRNIDVEQAEKYLSVNVEWLRRSAAVPPQLQRSADPGVQTLFVGREEHRRELEQGLRALGPVPLLTIGPSRTRLSGAGGTPGLADFIEAHGCGLPPARLPVDHESEDAAILELLIPAVVSAQAGPEDIVQVETLCQRILPEWPILSAGASGQFIGRVAQLLRELAEGEMKGRIRYEPSKQQPHTRGRLVMVGGRI